MHLNTHVHFPNHVFQNGSHPAHHTNPASIPSSKTTTGTFQYIVTDPSSRATVTIDPVLDFDPSTTTISTTSANALLALVAEKSYDAEYVLETHVHADHLSAASYLQAQPRQTQDQAPQIEIGKRTGQDQELFSKRYGVPTHEHSIAFNKLFDDDDDDDEKFRVGGLQSQAIHRPGHTPDHTRYKMGSHVFGGDSLFHADVGTARTDFPGGSAQQLWLSGQKLLALPDETRIWTGHCYPPANRTTHKEVDEHLRGCVTEDGLVKAPRLLHQSLQINVRGRRLPVPDEDGQRTLRASLKLAGVGLL
ncbi:hypothetical protein ST47_g9583 [Ascochyta rabiei]|uniref:Uncharacterized protein n=1 Tax=Didymella rabiei TaxID=5454 RepID=A0A162WXC9_DIDRA|nr:hypothetical protein ST47_g9583 [Ascochyta rabiei]